MDRANVLAGQVAVRPAPRLAYAVSIAWISKTLLEQHTATANIELRDKSKHTIIPIMP
jgi:hypothetical protein